MSAIKMAAVDSRVAGVNDHAIKAIALLVECLQSNKRRLDEGWAVYEDEARELFDSGEAALMFLHPDITAKFEPFLIAADAIGREPLSDGDDFGWKHARRYVATALVVALLGAPAPKETP